MASRVDLVTHFRRRWLLLLGALPAAAGCETYSFVACDNDAAEASGLAVCEGGFNHRPVAVTCDELGPVTQGSACQSDEHCAGAGGIAMYCYCGEAGGFCLPTGCRSDAECEAPYVCASLEGTDFLECQTADDECMVSADCGDDGTCAHDGSRRFCSYPSSCDDCPIDGRPFLVGQQNRRAPLEPRSDWAIGQTPAVDQRAMTAGEQSALAEHWADVGAMEHASIAAFARLALQLLALGAPPELIDRTTRAMADETRHATFAFKLASGYRGQCVGPGPLPVDGALDDLDLATLVRLAIREGCVGETAAALVMREGARSCEDPALRTALCSIADDELAHAELAWATIAWAIAQAPEPTARVIREELALLPRDEAAASTLPETSLARFGVASDASFRALRQRAVREIVAPLLRDVLSASFGFELAATFAGEASACPALAEPSFAGSSLADSSLADSSLADSSLAARFARAGGAGLSA